jgi:hypothetical protein
MKKTDQEKEELKRINQYYDMETCYDLWVYHQLNSRAPAEKNETKSVPRLTITIEDFKNLYLDKLKGLKANKGKDSEKTPKGIISLIRSRDVNWSSATEKGLAEKGSSVKCAKFAKSNTTGSKPKDHKQVIEGLMDLGDH